ncbi:hypothetical protein [Rhodoflexus sp.]
MKRIVYLIALLLSWSSCSKKNTLIGFDDQSWRNDYMGCQSKRAEQSEAFLTIVKPYLLEQSLREAEVRSLLGKADAIEIAERGMKFYKYYIEEGRQCKGNNSGRQGRYIQIRFNALNQVNEVSFITPNA